MQTGGCGDGEGQTGDDWRTRSEDKSAASEQVVSETPSLCDAANPLSFVRYLHNGRPGILQAFLSIYPWACPSHSYGRWAKECLWRALNSPTLAPLLVPVTRVRLDPPLLCYALCRIFASHPMRTFRHRVLGRWMDALGKCTALVTSARL